MHKIHSTDSRIEPRRSARTRRAPLVTALAGGALVLTAGPAAANGRFPAANQIVFSPTDPDLVVLRTSYGILPSHDNGATWSYLCEDAIGVGPNTLVDPSIALTSNNTLVAGVSLGLSISPDMGCNWNCAGNGLTAQSITDLAVRPDTPSSVVAITGSYVVQADSDQELMLAQAFETIDNGATWQKLGTSIDPRVVVTTIDVTKTDPNRLYVSGTRGFGLARTASLFVSKDRGQTWTEWPLPAGQFDPTMEDEIFIGGVDPTNADRFYIRSSALPTGGQSRLMAVSLGADGTPVFTSAHVFDVKSGPLAITGEMLGFALSTDGTKIYIGSKEDGLWVARASDLQFQKNSSVGVQCLATRGTELWACSAAVYGFVAGMSTDDGKTFTAKLPLIGALTGPIACSPTPGRPACGQDANASQCVAAFESFCEIDGCESPLDGSTLDAARPVEPAKDGGSRSAPPGGSSSSCDLAVVGGGGAAGLGAGFALVGIALQRRRRR